MQHNLLTLASILVAWSFGIWFLVGPATGWFIVPLAVEMSGLTLSPPFEDSLVGAGVFFGFGAGAVSSKIHDLLLYRAEDWIRGRRTK